MASKVDELVGSLRQKDLVIFLAGGVMIAIFLITATLLPAQSSFFSSVFPKSLSSAHSLLPGDVNDDGEVNIFDLGILAANWGKKITITPTLTPSGTPRATNSPTATRTPTSSPTPTVKPTNPPVPTATVAPTPTPALRFTIGTSASVNTVSYNAPFITYTIYVTHNSSSAVGVKIYDFLDPMTYRYTAQMSNGSCSDYNELVTCTGTIASGATGEVTLTVALGGEAVSGDSIFNQATVLDNQNRLPGAASNVTEVKITQGSVNATATPRP